ncbi:MAG TPA: tetratricopeptide repeat protein [Saprospiraceae bacterium]|nr:tetratricopeptide repeat protein [Saprospiraceae bacterium]HPN68551.1 tetratricopeptide repeat protein [Saprospiraceae bacterium]
MQYQKETLIILFWAAFSVLKGQDIDSLKQLLLIQKEDTNKVITYRMLSGLLDLQNPKEAVSYAQAGIALSKKLGFDKGTAGCLLNCASNFNSLELLDSALVYINEAILYAQKVGDPNRLALAFLNRADIYMQKQELQKSLTDCNTALKYADEANNDDRRARILQTIGSVYFYQEQYEKALEYYEKALKFYQTLDNKRMVAIINNNKGNIYKQIGQLEKAEASFFDAINVAEALQDNVNLFMYHFNLTDVYLELGNFGKAETHALKAMQYAVDQDITSQIAAAGEAIARVSLRQGQLQKAISFGENSLKLAKENEDFNTIVNVSDILSEAYEKTGNTVDALQMLKLNKTYNDSILRLQFNEDISAMQAKFDVDTKDREIKILEQEGIIKEEKLSRQRLSFVLLAFLTLAAILAFVFYIYRLRLKKKLEQLELRNKIAADLHDEVGSSLSSIHLLSAMASKQESSPTNKKLLDIMNVNAKETVDKMSDIVWLIKPSEKEGENLRSRIERFAMELSEATGINLTLQLDPLEHTKLNQEQRSNIYLIMKEALNNAAKYANAQNIKVSVTDDNKYLKINILDDGTGFDLGSFVPGNGVKNMENRTKELGGIFQIHTKSNQGCSIEFSIPKNKK